MRFRRLTTPFSRPPTSRRKMTWATSGVPGATGAATASLTRSGPACMFEARRDRDQHRSGEFAQRVARGILLPFHVGSVENDGRAIVTMADEHRDRLPEFHPVGIDGLPTVDPVPVPDKEEAARPVGDLRLDDGDVRLADRDRTHYRLTRVAPWHAVGRHEAVAH